MNILLLTLTITTPLLTLLGFLTIGILAKRNPWKHAIQTYTLVTISILLIITITNAIKRTNFLDLHHDIATTALCAALLLPSLLIGIPLSSRIKKPQTTPAQTTTN